MRGDHLCIAATPAPAALCPVCCCPGAYQLLDLLHHLAARSSVAVCCFARCCLCIKAGVKVGVQLGIGTTLTSAGGASRRCAVSDRDSAHHTAVNRVDSSSSSTHLRTELWATASSATAWQLEAGSCKPSSMLAARSMIRAGIFCTIAAAAAKTGTSVRW